MTIGLQPSADNVLVRLITTNNVGVDSTVEWAEVIAFGPGRRTAVGTLVTPDLTPGDQVALRPRSAVHLNIHGEAWAIVSASAPLNTFSANQPQPPITTRVRTSMLSRGGASVAVSGSSKAPCGVKRVRPSSTLSQPLIRSTSSDVIRGA